MMLLTTVDFNLKNELKVKEFTLYTDYYFVSHRNIVTLVDLVCPGSV